MASSEGNVSHSRERSSGGEESTGWFELQAGVRQGCVMSPILFSLFINGLARELKEQGQGVDIGGRRVQMLLYADDIVLRDARRPSKDVTSGIRIQSEVEV